MCHLFIILFLASFQYNHSRSVLNFFNNILHRTIFALQCCVIYLYNKVYWRKISAICYRLIYYFTVNSPALSEELKLLNCFDVLVQFARKQQVFKTCFSR